MIFVFAGNYHEFHNWCRENDVPPRHPNVMYVSRPEVLMGVQIEPHDEVVWYGNVERRRDYQELCDTVISRSLLRSVENRDSQDEDPYGPIIIGNHVEGEPVQPPAWQRDVLRWILFREPWRRQIEFLSQPVLRFEVVADGLESRQDAEAVLEGLNVILGCDFGSESLSDCIYPTSMGADGLPDAMRWNPQESEDEIAEWNKILGKGESSGTDLGQDGGDSDTVKAQQRPRSQRR